MCDITTASGVVHGFGMSRWMFCVAMRSCGALQASAPYRLPMLSLQIPLPLEGCPVGAGCSGQVILDSVIGCFSIKYGLSPLLAECGL